MSLAEIAPPRRRPTDGGYARGEETRARIVDAAMQVFAAEGFARASTRRIAAEAGVNPPALQYYFDSKEGLHRACGELIIGHCSTIMQPAMEAGEAALVDGGRDEALSALLNLLDTMSDLSATHEFTPAWSRFMTRAQIDDAAPAYWEVKRSLSGPMNDLTIRLIGAAVGLPADDMRVKLRAMTVMSQRSWMHHHRELALEALGWSRIGPLELAQVKTVVHEQTRDALLALRARVAAAA